MKKFYPKAKNINAKFLFLFLMICSVTVFSSKVDAQYVLLPLNGSVSGSLTPAGKIDSFKVTTNADGQINLTLTATNGLNTTFTLYDHDAVTSLLNGTTAGTSTYSLDGLATGTYYVKVNSYYNTQTPTYTLADNLVVAPVANEVEPNDTKAQANVLPLNDSVTGHINYYYDHHRDTLDMYKVTTNTDGLLRLRLISKNGNNVSARLFDNDGITVLNSLTTAGTSDISTDGLAAGTYYVQVNSYYNNQFEPYALADSLFPAPVANDKEPDSTRATALTLGLNSSTTGHIGYYYNNHRDTLDFYKITTTADGLLRLRLTSKNGNNVSARLFDNDGITVLNNLTTAGTADIATDGLAAGIYYVQINSYYNNQFEPYTLADSLFPAPVANDAEPDSSRSTALTLGLNSSTTGHIGYYYNNHRDTLDFYKITTTSDGLLRLRLTSGNGNNVSAYLIDNNGKIVLNTNTTASTVDISTDGLAAGTYYVQVNSYYNNQFEPYMLADSLFPAPVANDKEPDSSRATALTLGQNSSTAGHIGYYYNNHRDTLDFYKITTTADGLLRLRLASGNGNNVSALLFDNNGKTLLNSLTTAGTADLSTDGLAAGTYYVQVNSYYNNQFEPYTLADSLFTYNRIDSEPNANPYQGATIPANRTVTGHTDFYYNLQRDSTDWWKINYTGNGNMILYYNLPPNIGSGAINNVTFQVYRDTAAAPISNTTTASPSSTVNLTGLTQGYYWVKVFSYYNNQFETYSISDSFSQVKVAAISLLKSSSQNTCGADSIIYRLSGSHPPYTVRLYRNGTLYDSLTTASDSAVFPGLNNGNYYATVFGDGATGTAYAQASSLALMPPVPTGLNATNITGNSATLSWSMLSCTNYDTLEYRANDSATWKILITKDNSGVYDLTNLAGNTTYLFRVASVVSGNGPTVSSGYSATFTFKTVAALPVTLLNFSATANNELVTLNWSTATEINNKGFEIFRSTDGSNFTSIGFVAGAGNSDLLLNYQFTDRPGLSGNVFYRLKQVDLDANFVWSNIVSVTIKGQGLISFMPNPAKSFIIISSPVVLKQVRLLAMNGQVISVWQNVSPNAQLDLGTVASGTYLIEFFDGQSVQTMKLLKSN